MKIVCAWCKKDLGEQKGKGTSHGICDDCKEKFLGKGEQMNTKKMPCEICGKESEASSDAVSVVCGECVNTQKGGANGKV